MNLCVLAAIQPFLWVLCSLQTSVLMKKCGNERHEKQHDKHQGCVKWELLKHIRRKPLMDLRCAFPVATLKKRWECLTKDAHLFHCLLDSGLWIYHQVIWNSFILLVHKYLLCAYYVSGTVQVPGKVMINQRLLVPVLVELSVWRRRWRLNKQL